MKNKPVIYSISPAVLKPIRVKESITSTTTDGSKRQQEQARRARGMRSKEKYKEKYKEKERAKEGGRREA